MDVRDTMSIKSNPKHCSSRITKSHIRKFLSLLLVTTLLLSFTGCGSHSQSKAKSISSNTKNEISTDSESKNCLLAFASEIAKYIASNPDEANPSYSPANIYMIINLLAELSEGSSREQLLNSVNASSTNDLNRKTMLSQLSGPECIIASSLWLDEGTSIDATLKNRLTQDFGVDFISGKFGSDLLNEKLEAWLETKANITLGERYELNNDSELALLTTISFHANWVLPFKTSNFETNIFDSSDGSLLCTYMVQKSNDKLYNDPHFTAIERKLSGGNSVWFFLPGENTSVYEVISAPDIFKLCTSPEEWDDIIKAPIVFSLPKFDIGKSTSLKDLFNYLGVNDILDPVKADLLLSRCEDDMTVSAVEQALQLSVDENGCNAEAITSALVMQGLMDSEEVFFTLNRPFAYVIVNESGFPLFIGVINSPS